MLEAELALGEKGIIFMALLEMFVLSTGMLSAPGDTEAGWTWSGGGGEGASYLRSFCNDTYASFLYAVCGHFVFLIYRIWSYLKQYQCCNSYV